MARAQGKSNENPFRTCFGEIYRSYVGKQLSHSNPFGKIIDLDNDFKTALSLKIPDFAYVKEDICILIEVKTSLLKIDARCFFEEETLKDQIKGGNLNKAINQLNEFRSAILTRKLEDKRFHTINRVILLMVGYEDVFVINSSLLPLLEAEYKSMSKDLQLACISDIDMMGAAIAKQRDLVDLFIQKMQEPKYVTYAISTFLEDGTLGDSPLIEDSFKEMMMKMGVPNS